MTPFQNSLTDVAGLRVGHAEDRRVATGVTAVVFDQPVIASCVIAGGAPGVRDTALLAPDMTVEHIDALVLSGGSAFGLDACGGVQAVLRRQGRGFRVGAASVPIVPGAILFDLLNGGDKDWGETPFYWELGRRAAEAATDSVSLGSVGAGTGATTADAKGGIGAASAVTRAGFVVAALVAVNAIGSALVGGGPQFWAAPYERDGEFGALGFPQPFPSAALAIPVKGAAAVGTSIGVVTTDATLTKAQAHRLAQMAHGGMCKALRPVHAALDGDLLFAAGTATAGPPGGGDLIEIGTLAADCVARAVARAVFEAESLPFPSAQPSWRDRFRR